MKAFMTFVVRPTNGATREWPELVVAGDERKAIAAAYRVEFNIPNGVLISTIPIDMKQH